MSHSDYTKNILNIKDQNITFEENCFKEVKIENKTIKTFHGKLTYTPTVCPNCGCLYETNPETIIKYGFKKNCKIKLPKISNCPAMLILDKQRYYCKYCKSTFIAETNIVDFHKQISNNTKHTVELELMYKGTEKDIARRTDISSSSVNRIMDNISKDTIVKNNGVLPTCFGIDEFKATSDTVSKMAFIIVDQINKNIFEINNSRKSKDIEKYFKEYSFQERNKVEFITMDLYYPYYKLCSSLFKKAILIPDRFHIVTQARDALDKTRRGLCTKNNPNCKKLKKFWKLLLMDKRDLEKNEKHYIKSFRKEMSASEIVTYLINTNDELRETYKVYQNILYAIDTRNKDIFLSIITTKNKNISKHMKKALRTYKKMKKYILNAFDYEYSNGIVEGTNNLIKQVKHSACGYKKFSHLKARIMLIKGLYNPIKN